MHIEEKTLAQVAKQYEDEGYSVQVRPSGDVLPPFASDYSVDLIASRGNENVIVEVKRNQRAVQADPRLRQLAEKVNAQPNWRFDLVVVDAQNSVERFLEGASEPSLTQIEKMLDRAQSISHGGDIQSAYLAAWAAFEAAMRQATNDGEWYGPIAPRERMAALFSNGIVSREEFDTLKRAYAVRTQIVHGLIPANIDRIALDQVIGVARKILTANESAMP